MNDEPDAGRSLNDVLDNGFSSGGVDDVCKILLGEGEGKDGGFIFDGFWVVKHELGGFDGGFDVGEFPKLGICETTRIEDVKFEVGVVEFFIECCDLFSLCGSEWLGGDEEESVVVRFPPLKRVAEDGNLARYG